MDLRIQKVSAFSTDNASGKHSSVFQNLKKVNGKTAAANFPAHTLHNAATNASDKMTVDVAILDLKNAVISHLQPSVLQL
jgi:hypothetical protein